MNALVGLGVLLSELVYHQKMYGESNSVTQFITHGIQIFTNLTFDQTEYNLSWSYYNAEKGGKYAMSQLAKQVTYLIWAKFLVKVIKLQNRLDTIEQLKKVVIWKINELHDLSRIGAYGLGALCLVLGSVEPIKIQSQNHQLYMAGMIEQSDSILHKDMLQRIKDDSVSKLVEHKLTGKREITSNDIESLGYVLCNNFTETEKRNAFGQLLNVANEGNIDALGQLAYYQLCAGSKKSESVLPLKYDYLANWSLLRQMIDLIGSKPSQTRLIHLLEMLDLDLKFPPLDFVSIFEPILEASDDLILPVMKIYLNQSKSTQDLADHLVRSLVANINRQQYQKFIVMNLTSIIDCCTISSRLTDQSNRIIDFIFCRFPSKSIKYEIMSKLDSQTCERLLKDIIFKLDFKPERLAIWREVIKTVNHLDNADSLMSKISEEKRTLIIIGNLVNLEKFTYAMCSRQLLPQIKFFVASGSSSLWSLVQHFKKPLTLACDEHLLLDLVKLFEEQPSERLRTILEWIEEHGNEQFDELMTSRILDRTLDYVDEAKDGWKWRTWSKGLLRKAHDKGRLSLERLEIIANEHCYDE